MYASNELIFIHGPCKDLLPGGTKQISVDTDFYHKALWYFPLDNATGNCVDNMYLAFTHAAEVTSPRFKASHIALDWGNIVNDDF